jgi:hypothetical protein
MTLRKIAVAVAVSSTALVGLVTPAQAHQASHQPKPTFAKLVGPVKIDRHNHRVGYVHAIYRCTGAGTLWVSVKQTADRTRDPRLEEEGSSSIAAAWSDSHRNPVTCDGKKHLQRFSVDQTEPYFTEEGPQGQKSDIYGPLRKGAGWVQFCLFDDLNPESGGVPVSDMKFRRVIKHHHHHH